MFKGIIFDCDGVLFQSQPANIAYYNHIFSEMQVEIVTEGSMEADVCHTAASPEVFRQLLGADRVEDALYVARTVDYRQFIPLMVPEDGMINTIDELSRSLPLAIATNRGRSMNDVLEHFSIASYFQEVVTSTDVSQPKPAPDMLHLAAELLCEKEHSLIFIGDSILDYRAATGAGMSFLSFQWDIDGVQRIDSFKELLEYISKS
jgi:HAD superfamily hydrolase (TIGR01549 family)